MNIPKTVKIGGYDYVVERVKGPFPSGDIVCVGAHTASQTLIRVSDDGNQSYQETTFLHELCHGIVYVYCGERDYEEEFVTQFAKGLYQVIKDNPNIFKEIMNKSSD